MALMSLPAMDRDPGTAVADAAERSASAGIGTFWCNHDLRPPPRPDYAHGGITRVPFLVMALSGSFAVTVREHGRERTVRQRPGDAILHTSGTWVRHHHDRGCAYLRATFDSDHCLAGLSGCHRGRDLDDPSDFPPMVGVVLDPAPGEPVPGLVRGVLACGPTEAARRRSLANALLWELAAALRRAAPAGSLAIEMHAWVVRHAADPGIGREAIARAFNVSPTHVSRTLASWGGAHAIRERERLARAAARLADSDAALADIASACGFVDASHFARRFRLRYGTTPRTWRRALRSRGAPSAVPWQSGSRTRVASDSGHPPRGVRR